MSFLMSIMVAFLMLIIAPRFGVEKFTDIQWLGVCIILGCGLSGMRRE